MKSEEFTNNKGTYAAVRFSDNTKEDLEAFIDDNGIKNGLSTDDLHCTLLYSRKHLPNYKPLGKVSYTATPDKFEVWESPANAFKDDITYCLVLKLDCKELVDRFNTLMDEHEATFDYETYTPHCTLSYDVGEDFDLSTLNVSDLENVEVVEEYMEELDLDKTFN